MDLQDLGAIGMILVYAAALLGSLNGFIRDPRSAPVHAVPPRPLLTRTPRPCPFCGGESRYHWDPEGEHCLRCERCRDVYTTNAGGQTRWSITNEGGASELCCTVDEEEAANFIEKVLTPAAPAAVFEVRLGADDTTPYCWEYFEILRHDSEQDRRHPPLRH